MPPNQTSRWCCTVVLVWAALGCWPQCTPVWSVISTDAMWTSRKQWLTSGDRGKEWCRRKSSTGSAMRLLPRLCSQLKWTRHQPTSVLPLIHHHHTVKRRKDETPLHRNQWLVHHLPPPPLLPLLVRKPRPPRCHYLRLHSVPHLQTKQELHSKEPESSRHLLDLCLKTVQM